jgi:hypothetical protein
MTDIPLRPLCYVQDVKVAVNTAFDTFYKNPDKYSNLKQLMELVYGEFSKIPTYTPEFSSTLKEECEKYIMKADIPE